MAQQYNRNAPAVPQQGQIQQLPNVKHRDPAIAMDAVLGHGDLSMLTAEERAFHYIAVCESIGLNPKTQPFEYVSFQGRLVLYPRKNATDQLSAMHGITFSEPIQEIKTLASAQMLVTKMQGFMPDGRSAWDMSTIFLGDFKGQDLANQFMKGVTKARRRVTLALVGLGGDVLASDEDRPIPARIRESAELPSMTPHEIAAYSAVSDSEPRGEAAVFEAPQHTPPPPPDETPASDVARKAFFAVCRNREIGMTDQKALVWHYYGHGSRRDLTEEQARILEQFIRHANAAKLDEALVAAREAVAERDAEPSLESGPVMIDSVDEGVGSDEDMTWTEMWDVIRPYGYGERRSLEHFLGHEILDANPVEVFREFKAKLSAAEEEAGGAAPYDPDAATDVEDPEAPDGRLPQEIARESVQEQNLADLTGQIAGAQTKAATAKIVKTYNSAQMNKLVPSDSASPFFAAINDRNREIELAAKA